MADEKQWGDSWLIPRYDYEDDWKAISSDLKDRLNVFLRKSPEMPDAWIEFSMGSIIHKLKEAKRIAIALKSYDKAKEA